MVEEKWGVQDYELREGILYKKVLRNNRERELFVAPDAMRNLLLLDFNTAWVILEWQNIWFNRKIWLLSMTKKLYTSTY